MSITTNNHKAINYLSVGDKVTTLHVYTVVKVTDKTIKCELKHSRASNATAKMTIRKANPSRIYSYKIINPSEEAIRELREIKDNIDALRDHKPTDLAKLVDEYTEEPKDDDLTDPTLNNDVIPSSPFVEHNRAQLLKKYDNSTNYQVSIPKVGDITVMGYPGNSVYQQFVVYTRETPKRIYYKTVSPADLLADRPMFTHQRCNFKQGLISSNEVLKLAKRESELFSSKSSLRGEKVLPKGFIDFLIISRVD